MIHFNVPSLALQNSWYVGFQIVFENDIFYYIRGVDESNEFFF